ncbi:TPA: hypothetical protein ACF3I9_004447 [Klebsiella aerogenes]
MGINIHTWLEVRSEGQWRLNTQAVFPDYEFPDEDIDPELVSHPFEWRSYRMYAFLSGTRNDYKLTPIALPRGVPRDASVETLNGLELLEDEGVFSASWLLATELVNFDYEQSFVDHTTNPQVSRTYREFLPDEYYEHLSLLTKLGDPADIRIVFAYV